MRRLPRPLPPLAMLLALPLLVAPPAAADATEEREVKKIKVKKMVHECEGEDCNHADGEHKVIVIDKDGEVEKFSGKRVWMGHGDGHDLWVERSHKGGFLGIATTELTPELRRHFGASEEAGVLVARVVDDSAAAQAGVRVGDILTAVGGEPITSTGDLMRTIGRQEPGSTVELDLLRDGGTVTLGATLGERRPHRRHARVLHCDGGDCPEIASLEDFDCGGEAECKVEIRCEGDGACECELNGAATDCESLPGFAAPGG